MATQSSLSRLVISLVLVLAACGDDGGIGGSGGGTSSSTTAAASATSATGAGSTTAATTSTSGAGSTSSGGAQATVELAVDPTSMPAGATVTATVTVTGFVLEAPEGQPNQAGHGHFHLYLDGASGGDYLVAGETASVAVTIPAATPPGPHSLRVNLGQNNHAPLVPAVEHVVDIVVE